MRSAIFAFVLCKLSFTNNLLAVRERDFQGVISPIHILYRALCVLVGFVQEVRNIFNNFNILNILFWIFKVKFSLLFTVFRNSLYFFQEIVLSFLFGMRLTHCISEKTVGKFDDSSAKECYVIVFFLFWKIHKLTHKKIHSQKENIKICINIDRNIFYACALSAKHCVNT